MKIENKGFCLITDHNRRFTIVISLIFLQLFYSLERDTKEFEADLMKLFLILLNAT